MIIEDFRGIMECVKRDQFTVELSGRTITTIRIISLRRDGFSPRFLEGDRGPGVYTEFIEGWTVLEDGTMDKLIMKCPNEFDPDPKHGFLETGRRFELFNVVTVEFLEDMGLTRPLPGMLHLTDPSSLTVYRFRQV